MPPPETDSLLKALGEVLTTYNPWECVYRNARGEWVGHISTLRGTKRSPGC
jgi:hypothetical protein